MKHIQNIIFLFQQTNSILFRLCDVASVEWMFDAVVVVVGRKHQGKRNMMKAHFIKY
jgi:hypothetical protein